MRSTRHLRRTRACAQRPYGNVASLKTALYAHRFGQVWMHRAFAQAAGVFRAELEAKLNS